MIIIKIKYALIGGLSIVLCALCGIGILTSSDKEQISNKVVQNPVTTTVVSVTSISTTSASITTTTTSTTTTVMTTEYVETECTKEVYSTDSDYKTTVAYEESDDEYYESESEETCTDYGWYTAKWYPGSVGSWGYSGRELISGYSVASPDFPQGTLLQIIGGGLDGVYRVDDTGCPSGVIDFFYYHNDVPEHFRHMGVYDIQVSVVE